ncbi:hypothetical protein [Muricoccus aerilatus]|uniref:hypothetical protein n=1 Tax=Muricoccus aerilatus TaxID=452982 RepID=UPI000AE3731F|nr:hypothetical protein [Roseomonas aerilata]
MRPVAPLLLSLLTLAACQTPPPPAPVVTPRVARAPARPLPSRVDGAWSFGVAGDRCTAQVAHKEATLGITAGPGKSVTFSAAAPSRRANGRARIVFRGEDGNWEAPARGTGRTALATLPLDERGEAYVRDLLGGGTATVQGPGVEMPALSVPDAGVSGRDWYGCVSRLAQQ